MKSRTVWAIMLSLIIMAIVVFVIYAKIQEKEYWESQVVYKITDSEYLGIEYFQPEKYKSTDSVLYTDVKELLSFIISGVDFEKYEGHIIVTQSDYNTIADSYYNIGHLCLHSYYVIEYDNKAIVTFLLDNSDDSFNDDELEYNYFISYKTYPLDKLYLKKDNGNWKIVDYQLHP